MPYSDAVEPAEAIASDISPNELTECFDADAIILLISEASCAVMWYSEAILEMAFAPSSEVFPVNAPYSFALFII